MNKKILIIIILIALGVVVYMFAGRSSDNPRLIGGDKDEYGCLIPGGYTWCEAKQKCLRTWEEECAGASEAPSQAVSGDFNKSGNIVPRDSEGSVPQWKLIYEEPGAPALAADLVFTKDSECEDAGGTISCASSSFESGMRVHITGKNVSGTVTVSRAIIETLQ